MTTTFADLGIGTDLVDTLARLGIVTPFPIQEAVIPDALAGHDVSGRAPTGSGKTLAFGLPMLSMVSRGSPTKPAALVLAPTRELADQIRKDLIPLGKAARRFVGVVYGGVSYNRQIESLRRGVDVLVATPGRLLDLHDQGHAMLSNVQIVVVDEADRMADMGFLPDVKRILDMTPRERVTWLFSATLDGDVAELTCRYQRNPVRHGVGGSAGSQGTSRHLFWRVGANKRVALTAEIIAATHPVIVFCRTRRGVDRVTRGLTDAGAKVAALHGGRTQPQRSGALAAFKDGRADALIATDVAARGIHVDGVACVVHFDPPDDAKDYLHRSGRTARAGAGGVVVSLVADQFDGAYANLRAAIGLHNEPGRPDTEKLQSGGEALAPGVRPKPKTTPLARPRNPAGKKGKRSNKPKPRYWG